MVERRILPPFCVLDRYVLSEFLRLYLLALGGFTAMVLLFDSFEKIDTFMDYGAGAGQILRYYGNRLPSQALLVAPVAPLLAVFLALGRMTRFREVTVIKASGISLYRLFAPLYLMGILTSLATFAVGEWVMPEANRRYREIMDGEIKGRSLRNMGSRINVTYMGQDGRLYVILRYDVPREVMVDPMIQEFDGDRLSRRLDAREGIYRDGGWVLVGGVERTFTESGLEMVAPFDSLRIEVPETPADFAKQESRPEEMSFSHLKAYAERVRQSGSTVEPYLTEFHFRFSFPFTNLVVILIAASLAVQIRRGGVAIGFGLSLGIAFAYWCLLRAGQVLGNNGTLPPPLAAWLGNIVFLAFGAYLLFRTPK
jgi:lipopolysaccharide export system permease protein